MSKNTSRPCTPFATRGEVIPFFTLLGALLAIGSIWDFQISQALFDSSNPIATFFAAYGELPATIGFLAGGSLLVFSRNRTRKAIGAAQAVIGALLMLMGTFMACVMPQLYLTWPTALIVCLGLALSAATVLGIHALVAHENVRREDALAFGITITLAIFLELVLINIIKIPWGRPRMRLIAADPSVPFVPWWQPGVGLRDALVSAGVATEEFKSFPSGHSANAITLTCLALLPRMLPSLAGKRRALLLAGFGWGLVVALTRIIMGAHFLSDTVVGLVLGFACVLLVARIMQGHCQRD